MQTPRLILFVSVLGSFFIACTGVLNAQEAVSPAAAFREARALYDTPVDRGLQGFECDVTFDWKQFIEKANHAPVVAGDQRLAYLESIRLTVTDDLNGTGELHWAAPTTAPDASENSIAQIRGGMQQIWAGFFQTWNGFATGDMVSPDNKSTVERTPTGYHVFTRDNGEIAEENYSSDFTLQTLHVSKPQVDSVLTPVFEVTPRGRLITQINSVVKQPPTAPGTAVDTTVHYAPVNGFQLPSELRVNVANAATFDFHLNNCTVQMQLTPAPPKTAPQK